MRSPSLVPWPESIELLGGELRLTSASRVLGPAGLLPLLRVLAGEIGSVTGLRLQVGSGPPRAGDIVLRIDPGLGGEAHRVLVGDKAEISGADLHAIALGTTTFVQAIATEGGSSSVPRVSVVDAPGFPYRGLLIDVARHWHAPEVLKQLVVLARYYKIRFLQLHLTDDESFTFASGAFPELATPERHYTVEQLRELESFARARGVTLVPELDVPGHSAPMRRVPPFAGSRKVIEMASEAVYDALDQLLGEICEVFSSPYIHVGADECDLEGVGATEGEWPYMADHGLQDGRDLHAHFIVRMNEIVKRHGRQTQVWEGFRGTGSGRIEIPRDLLVFAWDTRYELPGNLLGNGYSVVNASWKPLYVTGDRQWSAEEIHGWNPYRWAHWDERAPSHKPIQLQRHEAVLGAQMCAWEQLQENELESLRPRLPAMSERLWQAGPGSSFSEFERRVRDADARLGRLVGKA